MIIHLVDGTYELFRHFYGQRRFNKGQDKAFAAVTGVLGTVLQMFEEGATHLGVATDHVIESFRNELWSGYKTGDGIDPALRAQSGPLEEALEAMGVAVWPMVELEADDALACAAKIAAADRRVEKVCIWTTDKDLAQCVEDDRVVLATPLAFEEGRLQPASFAALDAVAGLLRTQVSGRVEIAAHTSNVGEEAANERLSRERAEAVRSYLIGKGVRASRLAAMGYGETRPIDTNRTSTGRARNERIELVLPMVVKKDGRRERFDRQKLVEGLLKACEKRPVKVSALEAVACVHGQHQRREHDSGSDERAEDDPVHLQRWSQPRGRRRRMALQCRGELSHVGDGRQATQGAKRDETKCQHARQHRRDHHRALVARQ